ncbi:MAG: glycosyltransferase [Verrucomicrobia bacterium]|nr:glycosyltransferase [Verrucomicrobiota bacterium]
MKIVLFYHSLVSDWNHGNAHFLRGVASELIARGHELVIYEPRDSWSRQNLTAEYGEAPVEEFQAAFPQLRSNQFDVASLDLDHALDGAELVLVHEWNDPKLVRRIGQHHATNAGYALFFHDTHHRAITAPEQMQRYDLSGYDGVLAYGETLRQVYLRRGLRAWTWHEAADTRVFFPHTRTAFDGDIVWIGNWGDEERTDELQEFLVEPIASLKLRARVFGVRYPQHAREMLDKAGIEYGGWIANYRVPEVFARYKLTVHIPRRPYLEQLPGIPTIRPFEALACGIPLACSPWNDAENLFMPGRDYLVARDGSEMRKHIRALLADTQMAREIAAQGLATIRARHTCAHRVDELMNIMAQVCNWSSLDERNLETCAT